MQKIDGHRGITARWPQGQMIARWCKGTSEGCRSWGMMGWAQGTPQACWSKAMLEQMGQVVMTVTQEQGHVRAYGLAVMPEQGHAGAGTRRGTPEKMGQAIMLEQGYAGAGACQISWGRQSHRSRGTTE